MARGEKLDHLPSRGRDFAAKFASQTAAKLPATRRTGSCWVNRHFAPLMGMPIPRMDSASRPLVGWRPLSMAAWNRVVPCSKPSSCCRRALLDWSQQELADRAGVGIVTLRQLEGGNTQPRRATFDVIRRALESAGVEFIDENGGGPGVRLRKPPTAKTHK